MNPHSNPATMTRQFYRSSDGIGRHWEPLLKKQLGSTRSFTLFFFSPGGGDTKIMKFYNRPSMAMQFSLVAKRGEQTTYMGAVFEGSEKEDGSLYFSFPKKLQSSQKRRAQRALQTDAPQCTQTEPPSPSHRIHRLRHILVAV